MKKGLLLSGIFTFVTGIAFFTAKVSALLTPVMGYYFLRGIPAEADRMAVKYPGAFGIHSYVPYVLMGAGLLLILISILFRKKDSDDELKWKFKLPQFKTWKKRRTIVQFTVLGLVALHIILYSLGLITMKSICPASMAGVAIKGAFGVAAVFWIFILVGTLFAGRFLCGWLCVFGPMQEISDNLLRATGNWSSEKKSLHPGFIYFFAFLFWGSIIFNIVMNIHYLTFSIHNGSDSNISNIWGFVSGIITLIPLLMFFGYLWGSRFFCRNVCPIGGLLRIYSKFGFLKIKIDQDKCTDCSACTRNCQMNVNIDKYVKAGSASIKDGDCILCGDCIDGCPKKALTFGIA